MRVTIQKTLDLGEIPKEIEESNEVALSRLVSAETALKAALESAQGGRYVDCAHQLENVRLVLAAADKNIEEVQSLCLSYEKLRISNLMPTETGAPDDE